MPLIISLPIMLEALITNLAISYCVFHTVYLAKERSYWHRRHSFMLVWFSTIESTKVTSICTYAYRYCSSIKRMQMLNKVFGRVSNSEKYYHPFLVWFQLVHTSLGWNLGGMERWPHLTMQRAYHIELPTEKYQNLKNRVANK